MTYKKLYLHLFNTITDALYAMEHQNFQHAKALLTQAQLNCEEMYLRMFEVEPDLQKQTIATKRTSPKSHVST